MSAAVSEPTPAERVQTRRYSGLVTRAIAFVLDAALISLVAILVEIGTALILALLHIPQDLRGVIAVIGGIAYLLWSLAYFVAFWSTTGQTPGDRLLQIRVQIADGATLGPKRAAVRFGGLILAALPLFAGFVPILFDSRRRGLHDRLAGTVVIDAEQLSWAEVRMGHERAPVGGQEPARANVRR